MGSEMPAIQISKDQNHECGESTLERVSLVGEGRRGGTSRSSAVDSAAPSRYRNRAGAYIKKVLAGLPVMIRLSHSRERGSTPRQGTSLFAFFFLDRGFIFLLP